jgi:hypothetical protein
VTLILSCLTRDYVLQVSDRRLVFVYPNGTWKLAEDDQNKAVVVNRTLIFAYTGWAKIAEQKTNLWFAEVIKPFVDSDRLHEGTLEVARRATEYFVRQRYRPELKLHTFIGVGWQRRRRDGVNVPIAVRITNALDDQCRPLARARRDFVVHKAGLRRLAGIKVLANGYPVEQARLVRLERRLRRSYYLRVPLHSARVLAKELRSISDDLGHGGTVGKNLIVTCLPKVAALSWSDAVLGPPDGRSLSTFYVPAEGNRQIQKSSTIVQKGFPILLSDIEFDIPPPADGSDPYVGWR